LTSYKKEDKCGARKVDVTIEDFAKIFFYFVTGNESKYLRIVFQIEN